MGSRREHTKSRNGCSNCKRRRVRCNLQAPQCHHCKRRGEVCDFQYLNGSSSPESDLQKTSTTDLGVALLGWSSSNALSSFQLSTYPDQDPHHAQLLWHFTTSTSATLAMFGDRRWTWDTEVPLQAELHPFLLQGLMAVSALHISSLQPPDSEKYYSTACKSYRNATVLFRTAVDDINKDNCIAILAFSLLVSVFQFGISQAPSSQLIQEVSLSHLDAVLALRGAWSLINQLHPHLSQSRIQGLFAQRRNFGFLELSDDIQHTLDGLNALNRSSSATVENAVACSEAINVLRLWFCVTSASPSTWLHLVWWPSRVPNTFIALLKANDPVALVIFCHWCVGVHKALPRWFLAGWSVRTFSMVKWLLGAEWEYALEWPMKEILI
ncbi:hypothetical protein F5884DRAFT_250782 [Xylogone sp. PMI_703]|nr:hypothetical protein F5884DRAFT_250782 [Xylogone sp. PMI_703]